MNESILVITLTLYLYTKKNSIKGINEAYLDIQHTPFKFGVLYVKLPFKNNHLNHQFNHSNLKFDMMFATSTICSCVTNAYQIWRFPLSKIVRN